MTIAKAKVTASSAVRARAMVATPTRASTKEEEEEEEEEEDSGPKAKDKGNGAKAKALKAKAEKVGQRKGKGSLWRSRPSLGTGLDAGLRRLIGRRVQPASQLLHPCRGWRPRRPVRAHRILGHRGHRVAAGLPASVALRASLARFRGLPWPSQNLQC